MGVGKNWTRPESWPPVSSLVVHHDEWFVVHLTKAVQIDPQTGNRTGGWERISQLRDAKVFRSGRHDYSQAWHQTLPWMEQVR